MSNESNEPPKVPPKKKKLIMRAKYYPPGGPKIVREEFEKLGFEWIPSNAPFSAADAIWVMRLETPEILAIKSHQKVNWMPGMPEMCWKHLLHDNIVEAKSKYGEEAFSFWPRGFNLPEEYDKLASVYEQNGPDSRLPYILKPSMQACGTGIRCITHISQLPRDDPFLKEKSVAQFYIPNPLLLDGYKVTFRIYVLITSYSPLRAYIFPNGLGRICSHRYTTEMSSFDDLFAHLTNYDINKHNIEDFLQNKGDEIENQGVATDGLRTDFQSVMGYLKRQGKDTDMIWEKMKITVGKTLLACDNKVSQKAAQLVKYRCTTFEILGFDFLIDQDMEPWILEVNHAPNLEPHTPLETELKRSMIRDALKVVDVNRDDIAETYNTTNEIMQLVEQLNEKGLNIDSKLTLKQSDDGNVENSKEQLFPFSSLTRIAAWIIVETEMEMKRLGKWETIFPLPNADLTYHLKAIDGESHKLYNEGFAAFRNDIVVQFLKLNKSVKQIIEIAKQEIDNSL